MRALLVCLLAFLLLFSIVPVAVGSIGTSMLTIVCYGPDGEPLSNASVVLSHDRLIFDDVVASGTTDFQGKVIFSGIRAGRYKIEATWSNASVSLRKVQKFNLLEPFSNLTISIWLEEGYSWWDALWDNPVVASINNLFLVVATGFLILLGVLFAKGIPQEMIRSTGSALGRAGREIRGWFK